MPATPCKKRFDAKSPRGCPKGQVPYARSRANNTFEPCCKQDDDAGTGQDKAVARQLKLAVDMSSMISKMDRHHTALISYLNTHDETIAKAISNDERLQLLVTDLFAEVMEIFSILEIEFDRCKQLQDKTHNKKKEETTAFMVVAGCGSPEVMMSIAQKEYYPRMELLAATLELIVSKFDSRSYRNQANKDRNSYTEHMRRAGHIEGIKVRARYSATWMTKRLIKWMHSSASWIWRHKTETSMMMLGTVFPIMVHTPIMLTILTAVLGAKEATELGGVLSFSKDICQLLTSAPVVFGLLYHVMAALKNWMGSTPRQRKQSTFGKIFSRIWSLVSAGGGKLFGPMSTATAAEKNMAGMTGAGKAFLDSVRQAAKRADDEHSTMHGAKLYFEELYGVLLSVFIVLSTHVSQYAASACTLIRNGVNTGQAFGGIISNMTNPIMDLSSGAMAQLRDGWARHYTGNATMYNGSMVKNPLDDLDPDEVMARDWNAIKSSFSWITNTIVGVVAPSATPPSTGQIDKALVDLGNATKGSAMNNATKGAIGNATKGSAMNNATKGAIGNATKGVMNNATKGAIGNATKGVMNNATKGVIGNATKGSARNNATATVINNATKGNAINNATASVTGKPNNGVSNMMAKFTKLLEKHKTVIEYVLSWIHLIMTVLWFFKMTQSDTVQIMSDDGGIPSEYLGFELDDWIEMNYNSNSDDHKTPRAPSTFIQRHGGIKRGPVDPDQAYEFCTMHNFGTDKECRQIADELVEPACARIMSNNRFRDESIPPIICNQFTRSRPRAKSKSRSRPRAKSKSRSRPRAKSKSRSRPRSKSRSRSRPRSKSRSRSRPRAKSKSRSRPRAKSR